MVITAKKKSKTGTQILPKIIHIYSKTEKKGGHCTGPLIKKKCRLIFIHPMRTL